MTERRRSPSSDVVSKSAFARLINVSPARVSQMIAEGKIAGDALVGEGRGAMIRVAEARSQIAARTDVGQRLGNGINTRLELDGPAEDDQGAALPRPPRDPISEQIKTERLRALQLTNQRAAELRMLEQGRFCLAADVEVALLKTAVETLNLIDGAMAEMATTVAEKFGVPQRDVLHLLRAEFRTARERTATTLRTEAEKLPKFIEAHLPDVTDDPVGEA